MKTKRTIGVGMPQALLLQDFGRLLYEAFGEIPYHVGSSLTGKSWRDVDVRLLLDDNIYESSGFDDPVYPHNNPKWVAMVLAFSTLGKQMTGLPIDFQIQQRTFANKQYSQKQGHYRSALFRSKINY